MKIMLPQIFSDVKIVFNIMLSEKSQRNCIRPVYITK